MHINMTMLGQMISFVFFVWFCMKFVWPPLTQLMRDRQQTIAEGLEKAAQAEKQLEQANDAAERELEEAKKQAAELINQATNRSTQIVEEAKVLAREEGERIKHAAQAEVELAVNRAREMLRSQVSDLAFQGAERILEVSVDRERHQEMLNKLAAEL